MRTLLNHLLVAAVILAGASANGQQPGGFPQGGPGMGMRGQGPFMPGQGGPGMPPMTPTLAAKTAQVMALRRIVGLKLTRADIAAALPQVKALRAAEKALESAAEKALDEEKRALLAAGPNSAAPRGGGRTMREAANTLRARHEETWNALTEAIGPAKARGLQQLVGGGGGGFQMQPGMPGVPGMGGPGGGMPGMPGLGGGMRPNAGQRGGGGQGMRRPGGGMEGPGGPGGMPGMGGPGMGPGPMGGGQPGMGGPGGMMGAMPFRISVGELLELLEQKLAAMPR